MRYFIVKYLKKPTGQMDELVSVAKRLRTQDLQTSAVILDLMKQQVVMASMNGVTVPKDYKKIRDFYYQYYQKIFDDLEKIYSPEIVSKTSTTDTEIVSN